MDNKGRKTAVVSEEEIKIRKNILKKLVKFLVKDMLKSPWRAL